MNSVLSKSSRMIALKLEVFAIHKINRVASNLLAQSV